MGVDSGGSVGGTGGGGVLSGGRVRGGSAIPAVDGGDVRAHLIVTDAAARIGIHSRKDLGEAGVAPIEAVRRRRVGGAAAQDRAEGPCAATPLPAAAVPARTVSTITDRPSTATSIPQLSSSATKPSGSSPAIDWSRRTRYASVGASSGD